VQKRFELGLTSHVGGAPRTIYECQNNRAILKYSNRQSISGIKISSTFGLYRVIKTKGGHALRNRCRKSGKQLLSYGPDLPDCIATGSTVEETEREIHEAIGFHIE
jgi:hypothetical protein